jgi:hypothetical protein
MMCLVSLLQNLLRIVLRHWADIILLEHLMVCMLSYGFWSVNFLFAFEWRVDLGFMQFLVEVDNATEDLLFFV